MDSKTKHAIKPWVKFYQQSFFILFNESEKILQKLVENTDRKLESFSIVLLLRKMQELAYGQYSLLKNNEFLLLKSLNREAFECHLLIKFIGDNNTRERAIAYQIQSTLEKIKKLEILKPGTQSFELFNKEFQENGIGELTPTPEKLKELQNEIDRLYTVLNTEPLNYVYKKYFHDKSPRHWYSFEDKSINSLKDLAKVLNLEFFYVTHYGTYSEYIHGYNLLKEDIITVSSDLKQLEMYQTPSPPFDLAKDHMFFQTIFLGSIKYALKGLELEPKKLDAILKQKIVDHFNKNGVKVGFEFITKNKAYRFPKQKK